MILVLKFFLMLLAGFSVMAVYEAVERRLDDARKASAEREKPELYAALPAAITGVFEREEV